MKPALKILVIRLSALGDIVHSFPALRHIHNNLELMDINYSIDFVVYGKFKDLLLELDFLNKIHLLHDKKISSLLKLTRDLALENYDYVIDFQGLLKTGFISFFSLARKRVGFESPREKLASFFYNLKLAQHSIWDTNFHVVEHNLKLADFFLRELAFYEMFQGKIAAAHKPKYLLRSARNKDLRKVVIIPCTTWETKFWDTASWVELLERMSVSFPKARFFLTGVPAERVYLETITHQLLPTTYQKVSLVLDKGLIGLRLFFKDADLVLGVDTGPLHLAADALFDSDSAQILGIYGPSSGKRSGPYGFDYLSVDELFNKKATYKRTKKKDKGFINKVTPQVVFERILSMDVSASMLD